MALQKKKAGPVDGYRLVLRALVTYQVHFSPLYQSFASAIVSCPLASNISLLQLVNKQSCCSFVLLCWCHTGLNLHWLQGAKTAELQSVRTKAAEAIVDFIRFPDQYQFDLLEADAVVQLQKDPEFSALYQLLSILLRSSSIKVRLPIRCSWK